MQKFLHKIFLILSFFSLTCLSNSFAQIWTVGIPINTSVATSFFSTGGGAVLGCFPNPSIIANFTLPPVTGIQYYLKVTSVDPNSCLINPGNDTLQVGDSIAVNSATNSMSLFYFSSTATAPITMDLYATGTPTVIGQPHPCNISMVPWISNLMLCPEGISANVSSNCNVSSGPTSATNLNEVKRHFEIPSVRNNFNAILTGADLNSKISLYSFNGEIIQSYPVTQVNVSIPCSLLRNGLYFITYVSDGIQYSEKLSILR